MTDSIDTRQCFNEVFKMTIALSMLIIPFSTTLMRRSLAGDTISDLEIKNAASADALWLNFLMALRELNDEQRAGAIAAFKEYLKGGLRK